MKRLSIVLGSIGLLAGCGQILGLGDYEAVEDGGSGGSGGGGTAGTDGGGGGNAGDGGSAGSSNGGTAGSSDGGSAGSSNGGSAGTTTTGGAMGGNGGTGGSTPATTGMAGAGGAPECNCDPRNPCLTEACDDEGQCLPQPVGTDCLSGNFSGVCDEAQQCVPCVNDAPDTEVDSGCPETAPECDDTGATPECTGCTLDIHCDDGVDCTADTCNTGRCMRATMPAGAECPDGVCNGFGASDSCVPCVNNHATEADDGCEEDGLPQCDTNQAPAACVECLEAEDCDDDNECTTETCEDNECVATTVAAGVECLGGFCNGIAGQEACGACVDTAAGNEVDQGCGAEAPVCNMVLVPAVCTGCDVDEDCDDGIDCTQDSCNEEDLVCVHEPNDSVCDDSGDACNPNQCVPGVGCTPVNVSETVSILANGSFDDTAIIWAQFSTQFANELIVEEGEFGDQPADTPSNFAWLGGATMEQSSLSQLVTVPAGAQSLTVSFMWHLISDEMPSYPDFNVMGAELLSGDGSLLHTYMVLGNEDVNADWEEFTETIDATSLAGTDVQLHFWFSFGYYGYSPYCTYYPYPYYPYYYWDCSTLGITSFFIDTTALTASVCQ